MTRRAAESPRCCPCSMYASQYSAARRIGAICGLYDQLFTVELQCPLLAPDERGPGPLVHPHGGRLGSVMDDDGQDMATRGSADHRPHRRLAGKSERVALLQLCGASRCL